MPAVAQNFPTSHDDPDALGVDFKLWRCKECALVQIDNPPVPYFREVIRSGGISPSMLSHRRRQFARFLEDFDLHGKSTVEIGCGRGEFLEILTELNPLAWGLESNAKSVDACRAAGLAVLPGYPEPSGWPIEAPPVDGFITCHFLEHAPDPKGFLREICRQVSPGAVGMIEVPNFKMIERHHLASEIMLDHLWYFTKDTLTSLLLTSGFEILSCSETWHDYVITCLVRRRTLSPLQDLMSSTNQIRQEVDEFVRGCAPEEIAVWGAGHQSLAQLVLLGLESRVSYVVDSASFKQDRFTPGSMLRVVSPDHLRNDPRVRTVVVMGGSYSNEIVDILIEGFASNLNIVTVGERGFHIVKLADGLATT